MITRFSSIIIILLGYLLLSGWSVSSEIPKACIEGKKTPTTVEKIKLLTECINTNQLAGAQLSLIYGIRGWGYGNRGAYKQALDDYYKAIELNSNSPGNYTGLGIVYKNMGQFDKAIIAQTKAIDLDPSNSRAYYNRGNSYYASGQNRLAIDDFSKAIERDPRHWMAYFTRGHSHSLEKECMSSEHLGQISLKTKRHFPEVLLV